MSAIRRFDWSRENIRHTGITLVFVGLPAPKLAIIIEYVSDDSVLNHFNLVNILSAKDPQKKAAYSTRGRIFVYSLSLFIILT